MKADLNVHGRVALLEVARGQGEVEVVTLLARGDRVRDALVHDGYLLILRVLENMF